MNAIVNNRFTNLWKFVIVGEFSVGIEYVIFDSFPCFIVICGIFLKFVLKVLKRMRKSILNN